MAEFMNVLLKQIDIVLSLRLGFFFFLFCDAGCMLLLLLLLRRFSRVRLCATP